MMRLSHVNGQPDQLVLTVTEYATGQWPAKICERIFSVIFEMPGIFEFLTTRLLTFMSLLGVIRARRQKNIFDAFADILQSAAADLYREVEVYVVERWTAEFAALDVQNQGLHYFVSEASANRPAALLLEAACRLKGVQLAVWDLDRQRSELFGQAGPMHTVLAEDRYFIALIGEPVEPWHQAVARETAPGTSAGGSEHRRPEHLVPMSAGPEQVILLPVDHTSGGDHEEAANVEGASLTYEERAPGAEDNRVAGGQEEQATGEDRTMEVEQEPAMEHQPVREEPAPAAAPEVARDEEDERLAFRPADISALPSQLAAELIPPGEPAYTVHGRKITCRLPHCGAGDKEFATIGSWRKHVALSRSHLKDPFCGLCGHFIIVPEGIDEENIKAHITAHKRERCVAASKTVLKQRRAEGARLERLLRDASHILLPDEQPMEGGTNGAQQEPAMSRKRSYETEEARRADICAGFLKRFKTDHPQLMAQIAHDYQLELP